MLNNIINNMKEKMELTIKKFKDDLTSIRSHKAHPNIISNIIIEHYNTKIPIKTISNITNINNNTLKIITWEKNLIQKMNRERTKD